MPLRADLCASITRAVGYELSVETPDDGWEVEALLDTAFAPGRTSLSSYRLRTCPPVAALCHVARDELGILAGAIRFWPVRVAGLPALLLGPVAVHPPRQGAGLGALLIEGSLEEARRDWERILLVGDGAYYSRFGFSPLPGVRMPPPTDPARVLGRELAPGAWQGVTGEVVAWNQPMVSNVTPQEGHP